MEQEINAILDKTNLVLLGSWNMGIITPQWLLKQFPEFTSSAFRIEAAFGPITEFKYSLDIPSVGININPQRLIIFPITPGTPYSNVTKIASGILNRLPHTPISAVGHNFTFGVDFNFSHEIYDRSISFYTQKIKDLAIFSQEIKYSFPMERCILNLSHEFPSRISAFNFHYEIVPGIVPNEAVTEFEPNWMKAKKILTEIIK